MKLLETDFGYFDEERSEYVVTTADAPPYTTIGGLSFGTEYKHAIFYSNGAGYTWEEEDANERRLCRFNLGGSEEAKIGKFYYLKDTDTGELWAATAQPITSTEFEEYECRLGFGYIAWSSTCRGVASELQAFIPLEAGAPEVHQLSLRNQSSRRRDLELYTYVEFPNGSPQQEAGNPQNFEYVNLTEVDDADPRIVACKTFWRRNMLDEPEKHRRIIFFASSREPADTETRLDRFEGTRGSLENPARIRRSTAGMPRALGETGVASQKIRLTLDPEQQQTLHFILSTADSPEECRRQVAHWLDRANGAIPEALARLRDRGAEVLRSYQCRLPDEAAQVMANTWGPIQVYANWLFSRSVGSRASGQSRGLGTRDSWQDVLGYLYMLPGDAKQRIEAMTTATHLEAGDSRHSYNPRTGASMEGEGFSDDHLWAVMAVNAYLEETGDFGILDAKFAYADNPARRDTLYNHLLQSVEFTFRHLGPHGLPLILRADWNDALQRHYKGTYCRSYTAENLTRKLAASRAESVMVAAMLVRAAKDLRKITARINAGAHTEVAERLDQIIGAMTTSINTSGWDAEGGYYVAGSDDEGKLYGSSSDEEGSIHLLPQAWAVISGVATHAREQRCMQATVDRLLRHGGLLLFHPAYDRHVSPLGSLRFYLPYFKENAGCFCHAAAMGVTALLMAGRGDDAYRALGANLPPRASAEDPLRYRATPYTWSQVINGENGEFGAGGDWLTGAAAWYLRAIHQYMLGVRPDYDGLVLDPCIPRDWAGYSVTRIFRGNTYRIEVQNPDRVSRGIVRLEVDGQTIGENLLPVSGRGETHAVRVVMGAA